ncbi:MAG: hypothetical protein WCF92_00270 [bacterium]
MKIDESETARLTLDGQNVKIIANTYSTNRNFIFQDNKTSENITTLSVTNPAVSSPSYRIVKGNTHDWLVVTKIDTWGTGLRYDTDEWYVIDPAGILRMVLSYKSGGLEVPGDSGRNMYLSTDAFEGVNKYDTSLDIKATYKDCSRKEDGSDNVCAESSSVSHYVWDGNKEEFILK